MKKSYLTPLTYQRFVNFEKGILVYSDGQGGANGSAMTEDDELFGSWD